MRTDFDKRASAVRERVVVRAQSPEKSRMVAWLAVPLIIIAASTLFTPGLDTLLN